MIISTIVILINGVKGEISVFLVEKIADRIDSAIYALLGFYVCSAAYRSFKLKNLEATILLASAVLLMLAQAPIGDAMFPGISKVGEWILNCAKLCRYARHSSGSRNWSICCIHQGHPWP
jgi:predicted MFS family arabinose efflux permease